jgi:REP element-mobilizing transposase RayT
VQAIETRLKEIIGHVCQEQQAEVEELEVMPDLVQQHGECRSQVWHSSAGDIEQRAFYSFAAPGISGAHTETANRVDALVLCGHNRWCAARHHLAVHRAAEA